MSLTISQLSKTELGSGGGGRFPHEFSTRLPLPFLKSRGSTDARIDSPVSSLRVSASTDGKMSTPHRGLPPPSAMTLPDPTRPHPPSLGQPLGAMPSPPNQWQGQEDSMRNWLVAKAEEDKRKQEEEKTRQESYRLEQRRCELSMLRESLQAGVPPSAIPMIYAGIGGANLANVSVDWLQQYAAQLQQNQRQVSQQSSPEVRQETRLISQTSPYGLAQPTQQQAVPRPHAEQTQTAAPLQTTFSAYQPTTSKSGGNSTPRSATHTQLPRLTTNEMYVHQPVQANPGSAHPLQQSQTLQQDQPASSPSIYFHHWVPPTESSKTQPQTPAGKGDREPHSAHPGSHRSENDYKESPRKRKAQGSHPPNPPPTSAGPAYTSPSFSTTSSTSRSKGDHARSRSNASTRDPDGRPDSRRGRPQPDPPRPSHQLESTSSSSGPLLGDDRRPRDSPQYRGDHRMGRLSAEAPSREFHHVGSRPESRREER